MSIQPPKLDLITALGGGRFQIHVSGTTGRNCLLQASSDLANWSGLAIDVFNAGATLFSDTSTANPTKRFYRAVLGQ